MGRHSARSTPAQDRRASRSRRSASGGFPCPAPRRRAPSAPRRRRAHAAPGSRSPRAARPRRLPSARPPARTPRRRCHDAGARAPPSGRRSHRRQSKRAWPGTILQRMRLTLACGRYDRTQALIDGRVKVEGVSELNYLALRPGETFWRMLNHQEFDASEMSLSSYTILRSEGDERFIALPVFPSRVFRQNALYVRADSPLRSPSELKGRRIGVGDYQMTAAVWTRGFLQHEYGVPPQDATWVVGRPIRTIEPPRGIRLETLGAGALLEAMLEHGEID